MCLRAESPLRHGDLRVDTLSSSPKILKAGFLYFDSPSTQPKIIVFQYNPESLSRTLNPAASLPIPIPPPSTGPANPNAPAQPASTAEVITFNLVLDATDKLEIADPRASEFGVFPLLSALELLMYAPPSPASMTLFVFGPHRILPVQLLSLQIVEQMFDTTLNPIQATVAVTLRVLKDADLPAGSPARRIWDAHFAEMQQLAQFVYSSSLSPLGLPGLP